MGRYDYVPGINSPYDTGIHLSSPAILDTGANTTYVTDGQYITDGSASSCGWISSSYFSVGHFG